MGDCLFVIKFEGRAPATPNALTNLKNALDSVKGKIQKVDFLQYLIDEKKGVLGLMRVSGGPEVEDAAMEAIREIVKINLNGLGPNQTPSPDAARWGRVDMPDVLDKFQVIGRPDDTRDDNPYEFKDLVLRGGIGAP